MEALSPWRGVELRHIATLVAVADTGSFNGAASVRGYAPSAVSQQVAQLERIVGHRLVERQRGRPRVELTRKGRLLVDHGRAVLASSEAARADVGQLGDTAGEMTLAFDRALVGSLLPPIARALGDPSRVLLDETDDGDEPARRVERGRADVGIGTLPATSSAVAAAVIDEDAYELLVRASDSSFRRPVTLADLLHTNVVLPTPRSGTGELGDRLARLGVPESHLVVAHPRDVATLVRAGAGAAVVSELTAWGDETGLSRVVVRHLLGVRAVAATWHPRRLSSVAHVHRLTAALPSIRSALASRRSPGTTRCGAAA